VPVDLLELIAATQLWVAYVRVGEVYRLPQFGRGKFRSHHSEKAKYGGMAVSDLKRMKEMEEELSRLKRMYADLALENQAMKDLIEKNSKATGEAGSGQIYDRRTRFVGGPQLSLCGALTRRVLPRASGLAPAGSRAD
jgi:hypothetical protein